MVSRLDHYCSNGYQQKHCSWFKVAEHSFSARFCWCKLAVAQGFQKTNMPSTEQSFYLLNTCTICVIFLYNCMQCIDGLSILLQRCVRKGNDAKNPAILRFFFVIERTQLNAAHEVSSTSKICYWMRNSFLGNTPFPWEPLVTVSGSLAQEYSRK